jgi:crotonobetainyl-CoA:carnitine CoA-transferase CaiB-like acyl-CoA transferase
MWERLSKVMGLEPLIQDKRFLTVADRVTNRFELTQLLGKKLSEKTNKEWEAILDKAGVANGPILYIDEVFKDPQVLHQKMLMEIDHPTAGKIKSLGFPVKLSRTPAELRNPPPLLGQHTEEVLKELGYRPQEIETMHGEGVI